MADDRIALARLMKENLTPATEADITAGNNILMQVGDQLKSLPADNVAKVSDVRDYNADIQFLFAFVDKEGKIIFGIEKDGNVTTVKVPENVKREIEKVAIRSIQDCDGEYAELIKDSDDNIVEYRRKDMSKTIFSDYAFLGNVTLNKLTLSEDALEMLAKELARKQEDMNVSLVVLGQTKGQASDTSESIFVEENTIYVGGREGVVYKKDATNLNKIISLGNSENLAKENTTSRRIKKIVTVGDYLYVGIRGNGSGMFDTNYSAFISPFENQGVSPTPIDLTASYDGWATCIKSGDVQFTEVKEPSPSRYCYSAKLVCGQNSYARLRSETISINDTFYYVCWIKNNGGYVEYDVLGNATTVNVKIVIDDDGTVGLSVDGSVQLGNFRVSDEWHNYKIAVSGGIVSLYCRTKECMDWNLISSSTVNISNLTKAYCGAGANANILIDDVEYDYNDIETKCYVNGSVVILDKNTLGYISRINLNLRVLDLCLDGTTLYVAMLGGVNVYDVTNPLQPILIDWFRDTERKWQPNGYRFKVFAQEYQRMVVGNYNGRKMLFFGCDTAGLTIVEDIQGKLQLVKECSDIPLINCVRTSDGVTLQREKCHEWGCVYEYPYVYMVMGYDHNYLNGTYDVNDNDISWGLKVIDISDIDNIHSVEVVPPTEYRPSWTSTDNDGFPNYCCRVGNSIIVPLMDKGVGVFEMKGLNTNFVGCKSMPTKSRNAQIHVTDDQTIYVSNYSVDTNVSNDRTIFILKRG